MSVNSNAVGKDVGNGIVLEIVIGVALPIQDGLRCNAQESAPPTVADNIGSYAPPLVGICVVFNHRAFIFVVVMANVEVVFQEQEGDESSASEGGVILH